jgi:trimethylamine--corrinoid protein Co-methyltransferase
VFGDEFVEANTVVTSLINASSPMAWDATMLGAADVYAQHNRPPCSAPSSWPVPWPR